jgi:hypothetical protein
MIHKFDSFSKILRNGLAFAGLILLAFCPVLFAQTGADLQARIGDLKESMARNKQALSQYTWEETLHVILKGEQKKTEHFEVRQGPDGKPIKTPLDAQAAPQGGGGGRLRQRIVQKKKEEYEEYTDQMKELAAHYVPPNMEAIQDAYSKGNISITPGGEIPGEIKIVIHNYYKPGDTVTLRFDKDQKQLKAISIATWIDKPDDAMNLNIAFDRLPDGTNHVASTSIEGIRKQLTITTTNSDYRRI